MEAIFLDRKLVLFKLNEPREQHVPHRRALYPNILITAVLAVNEGTYRFKTDIEES